MKYRLPLGTKQVVSSIPGFFRLKKKKKNSFINIWERDNIEEGSVRVQMSDLGWVIYSHADDEPLEQHSLNPAMYCWTFLTWCFFPKQSVESDGH